MSILFMWNLALVGAIAGVGLAATIWAIASSGQADSSRARFDHCTARGLLLSSSSSSSSSYYWWGWRIEPVQKAHAQKATEQQDANRIRPFEPGFYEKVSCLIDYGETRPYSVIIIVAEQNKDLLIERLKLDHGATQVVRGLQLSFVTAKIPITEIPNLANYDFIILVADGERKLQPT